MNIGEHYKELLPQLIQNTPMKVKNIKKLIIHYILNDLEEWSTRKGTYVYQDE